MKDLGLPENPHIKTLRRRRFQTCETALRGSWTCKQGAVKGVYRKYIGWVLPPLSSSWIILIIVLYVAPNRPLI